MNKVDKRQFNDFLIVENDNIDNAAYELISALAAHKGEEGKPEWDMSVIGDVIMAAQTIMEKHGIDTCHPGYDDPESGDMEEYYDEDNGGVPCAVTGCNDKDVCPFLGKRG